MSFMQSTICDPVISMVVSGVSSRWRKTWLCAESRVSFALSIRREEQESETHLTAR